MRNCHILLHTIIFLLPWSPVRVLSRSTGLTDPQRTLLTVVSAVLTALSINILAFSSEVPRDLIIVLTLAGGVMPIVREFYGVNSAANADQAAVAKTVDPTIETDKKPSEWLIFFLARCTWCYVGLDPHRERLLCAFCLQKLRQHFDIQPLRR